MNKILDLKITYDGKFYVAEFRRGAFAGCVSQGKTLESCLNNISSAVRGWNKIYWDHGGKQRCLMSNDKGSHVKQ